MTKEEMIKKVEEKLEDRQKRIEEREKRIAEDKKELAIRREATGLKLWSLLTTTIKKGSCGVSVKQVQVVSTDTMATTTGGLKIKRMLCCLH